MTNNTNIFVDNAPPSLKSTFIVIIHLLIQNKGKNVIKISISSFLNRKRSDDK